MNVFNFFPNSQYDNFILWVFLSYMVYIILPWLGWRPQMPSLSIMITSIYRVLIGICLLYLIFIILDATAFLIIQYIIFPLNINDELRNYVFLFFKITRWVITICFLHYFIFKHRPNVPSAILPFGLALIILPCSAVINYGVVMIFNFITQLQIFQLRPPLMPWFLTPNFNWITFPQVTLLALGLELIYQFKRPISSIFIGFIFFWGVEILVNQFGHMTWLYICILPIAWIFFHLRNYNYVSKKG